MSKLETIDSAIFLFRDLITEPSMTIRLHVDKINSFGSCWWGWWKKAIEDVPSDFLSGLVQSGAARIFLFDSGMHEIYQATLRQIEVSPSDEPIHSPEIALTPDYYLDVRLITWLRLTSIGRVHDKGSLFSELVYAGFPSWRKPIYTEFIGQPIKGTEELDAMIVTMWRVQLTNGFEPSVTEI